MVRAKYSAWRKGGQESCTQCLNFAKAVTHQGIDEAKNRIIFARGRNALREWEIFSG